MKKSVLFILTAALMISMVIFPVTANAAGDTTPPVLVGVSVNKADFVVGETIIITVTATDDLTGLARSMLSFGIENRGFSCDLVPQGDGRTLAGECRVEENSFKSGTYQIDGITLIDNSGNQNHYSRYGFQHYQLLPPEMAIQFTVTNNIKIDWDGPVLQSLTADRTEINAGDTIVLTAAATDRSGLSQLAASLIGPKTRSFNLQPVEGAPELLRSSITIPADYPDGVYTIDGCMVFDTLGNCRYYANVAGDGSEAMPAAARVSIRVHGQAFVKRNVRATDIQITPAVVKQGDPVTIRVTLDKGGNRVDRLHVGVQPVEWAKKWIGMGSTEMTEIGEGVYECTVTPPVNWPAGQFCLSSMVYDDLEQLIGGSPEWGTTDFGRYYSEQFPVFTVNSVFSGTENSSVMVGSAPFDPLAGVAAANGTEGNLTGKIEVAGSVDTSKAGVYLLKYKIPSIYRDNFNPDKQFYYYDFRWIGVTEIQPQPVLASNAPLAVTDGSMEIGAESADATLKKDGSAISFSKEVSEPGEYSVTYSGAASAGLSNSSEQTLGSDVYTMNALNIDSQKATTAAVIDRSGPSITATWQNTSTGIPVKITAEDVSGVVELKYLPGECSLEQLKSSGIVFTSTFIGKEYGKYTVYSRDNFGNEKIDVINITEPKNIDPTPINSSPVNSPGRIPSFYLADPGLSAGTLSRPFSPTVTSYKITIGENEGSFTLTPVKQYDGAMMTINKKAVQSYTVSLANGKSVKVSVKVTLGRKSKTYTFTVTRLKSSNNYLSSLSASAGTWSQAFDPNVLNYTLTLDENTKSTAIRVAAAAGKAARVSPASKKISLNNGQSKTLKITVKAQSGARRTYTINVVRAPSTNADLKTLRASGMSPGFSPGLMDYTITLPVNKSSVTISAKAVGYKATVYFDGAKRSSKKVILQAGQSTTVRVTVVAQSGASKTYTINIVRQISEDANLKSLKASGLTPGFSPGLAEYSVILPANKSSVSISAKAAGYDAAVYIDGAKKSSKKVVLANGQSAVVRISVAAQAGNTKEYVITVIRQ